MADYVKINYSRKTTLGIPSPFYHSSLEIKYKNKIKRLGFYAKTDFYWFLSLLLISVPGEIRNEKRKINYSVVVSRDSKKIKKLISLLPKFKWKKYHVYSKNCFHWRNALLNSVGIKSRKKDWFWKV